MLISLFKLSFAVYLHLLHSLTTCRLVDESKHHVLRAAHPSGLSANRGFFGCRSVINIITMLLTLLHGLFLLIALYIVVSSMVEQCECLFCSISSNNNSQNKEIMASICLWLQLAYWITDLSGKYRLSLYNS